jgi:hypothetical protein
LHKENILLNLPFINLMTIFKKLIEMKKLLLSLALVTGFTGVNAQTQATPSQTQKEPAAVQKVTETADATIDFVSKIVDYGLIENKSDGAREFVFTNNGTEPLIIKNAKGSCGCTVPTWPKEPIAAGATAKIGVKYDTKRTGKFTKTITLTTNADKRPVILTIKGEVNPPAKDAQTPEKKTGGAPLEKK